MWCGIQVSPSVSIAGNRYILPAPGPLELVMAVVVAGITHRFPQPNIGIKKMSQETVSGTI